MQEAFEFYDFFLVGYLVAVLAPSWHLTYGESSLMLLSAGAGSIVGALFFGRWSDRIGRKMPIAWGGVVFSIGCGACALIPSGSWVIFSICRFAVGFGLAGAVTTQNTLVVEMTPTRYRTFLSSMMLAPASVGITFSAIVASHLLPIIGWRWLCATGALPIFISLGVWLWVPESVRWLLTRNRFDDARREAARQLGVPVESVQLPTSVPIPVAPAPLSELLRDQKRFWWVIFIWTGVATSTYGVQLWGPTILSQLLRIPASTAANYFIALSIMGFLGRFMFAVLPVRFGRRRAGQIQGLCSALVLLTAALFYREFILGWSVFALCIITCAFFLTGGYANMTPYTVEAYPVRLSARALGLGQSMNGIGKVLGPLCLALIAGSSNMVSAKATEAAVRPAFLFLAGCSFSACIAYTLFHFETHGRPLNLRNEGDVRAAAAPQH
jgi:putative MFS transporter